MGSKDINRVIVCLFLLCPLLSYAQPADLGNWLIYIGSKDLGSKFNLHHEIQYRNYNAIGDLEQLLIRGGLGYDVGDRSNALVGYGFIRSENYINDTDKEVVNEHRIFQQFITKQNVGKLGLQHRYRFEQRFVEDNFRLRFRYFLGLTIPISSFNEGNQALYLSIYDEVFLNTVANVFDRNRLYGALGYRLSASVRIEAGYMNQFLANGNRDQINIVLFGNF